MANISILGEGSWGLGLAILLYNNGHQFGLSFQIR